MTIDYSTEGKVIFRMNDYVENLLAEVRDEAVMNGTSPDPANDDLFTIDDDKLGLGTEDKECFHTMVAKLLFLSKRARPDIQQAVAFLTTRVSKATEEDYGKLARVIRYLRGAPTLPLTLECDNTQIVKWWIDASFGVHPDLKSHTGATMSLGKGSVYSSSVRQKLNTRSSTEAEVVAVDDMMPITLWTRQFLHGQGYTSMNTELYQDNKSAMLLEQNAQASSGKQTRHINLCYFFITDRVKSGEIAITHCPTDEMTADFFTKPLNGKKFIKFRAMILNLQDDDLDRCSSSQECVGS